MAAINPVFEDSDGRIIGDVVLDIDQVQPSTSNSPGSWLSRANQRQHALTELYAVCKQWMVALQLTTLATVTFCQLFSKPEVLQLLFLLLDHQAEGKLVQADFIEFLRAKVSAMGALIGYEFVDQLDTALFHVTSNERELGLDLFVTTFLYKGVLDKFFKFVEHQQGSDLSLEKLMRFVTELTLHRRKSGNLSAVNLECADEYFKKKINDDTRELTLDDFKKMIPCKNPFFAERAFRIFDKDGSNSISIVEFRESLEEFCGQSVEDKVRFLFQIYDLDGDGYIKLDELHAVMKACTDENGMKFSDEQLDQLTLALYQDAAGSIENYSKSRHMGIQYEQIKAQMDKHPGLLENLSISLESFLVPAIGDKQMAKKKAPTIPSTFTLPYLRNNIAYISFMFAYLGVNLGLFVGRIVQYGSYSALYVLARASGQALNFNCTVVVMLMLRHCIAWLRMKGAANYLPLDRHIHLHKICGLVIAALGALHTLMHILNFSINVAGIVETNVTGTPSTFTASEWLFTAKPGMFGLVPGWACVTGWGIFVIVTLMTLCSLPFVRRNGSFEVFYYTHLLCVPCWILLILHCKHFYLWFIIPGALFFLVELTTQFWLRWAGKGRTYVSSVALLPGKVTHLTIQKPASFNYHPGDYVYVKIPSIASSEWHPFTISSAPELSDSIWLHIRAVGGWTNKLYNFFEAEQKRINEEQGLNRLSTFNCIRHQPGVIKVTVPSHLQNGRRRTPTRSFSIPATPTTPAPTELELDRPTSQKAVATIRRAISDPNEQEKSAAPVETEIFQLPEAMVKKPRRKVAIGAANDPAKSNSRPIATVAETRITTPLEVIIDGPYGTPSSHIFGAEHAVLIAAGIGVTPFASILQSIMNRYYASRQTCPQCNHTWAAQMPESIMKLKKVDFFWINREQRSFEWFVDLLSQLEMEQAEKGGGLLDRFLDLHMYITSALKRTDMKALGLQMALDLLHAKEKRDLVTGLKTRTHAGRPNWEKTFQKLSSQNKGRVTVFYCGPPQLGRVLGAKCIEFGFDFRKEIF